MRKFAIVVMMMMIIIIIIIIIIIFYFIVANCVMVSAYPILLFKAFLLRGVMPPSAKWFALPPTPSNQ